MEEIKVGEYVRINKDFRTICLGIGKVVNKNQNTIYIKMSSNDLPIAFNVDSIAKHSPNIIDLIEVGDYVNGYFVITTDDRINDDGEKIILTENYDDWTDNGVVLNKDIKSIVTHEQFDSIRYEVI